MSDANEATLGTSANDSDSDDDGIDDYTEDKKRRVTVGSSKYKLDNLTVLSGPHMR